MLVLPAAPSMAATYSTSAQNSWVPANGRVYAMELDGGVLYLGGTFTRLRNPTTGETVDRQRLAALDAVTGAPTSWDPGANDTVRAIEVHDGTVYAGGNFTTAAGRPSERLAAITTDGDPVAGWSASANRTVRDILVHANQLFVSGRFNNVDGRRRVGVAELDRVSGALIRTWDARVRRGRVWALSPSPDGTALVLGGNFGTVQGLERPYLASVDLADGATTSWSPQGVCAQCRILQLTSESGDVYAAIGGPGGGRAASWDGSSGKRRWLRHGDGDVQALDVHDGVVYAGGHFGPRFGGEERHQLVALDASNGALLPFEIPFTGSDWPGIWSVIADGEALRLAGGFRGVQGTSAARYANFPML